MSYSNILVSRRVMAAAWLIALAIAPQLALAQYTYVNSNNQTGNWNVANRWTGGGAGTFPNAADATATFNLPLSNAPSGNYNVQLGNTAGQSIIVGAITVNNYSDGGINDADNLRFGANGNGTLTFQTTSGSASYTENAASPTDSAGLTRIFAPVTFASDTVITQNHAVSANSGTAFSSTANSPGGTTAAPGVTLRKEGLGNVQFEVAPTAPDTGFQGNLVVNQGGVRLESNVFANAGAITVNDGGQLQLGSGTVTDWGLAPGGALTLHGAGKAAGTVNSPGALRFQNNSVKANFNNAVDLASTSTIFVSGNVAPTPPNPVTRGHLVLANTVSGEGGLNKSGAGILELTQDNSYAGPTTVNAGILLINNTTGSATGNGSVTVNSGAALAGGGTIAGPVTVIGGSIAPGNSPGQITVGPLGLDSASTLSFELGTPDVIDPTINDLIVVNGDLSLAGTLNVTALTGFGVGTYRLFNYTGSLIDAGLAIGEFPTGFLGQIDTSSGAFVDLQVSAVPEPSSIVLAVAGISAVFAVSRTRKPRSVEVVGSTTV